MEDRFSPVPRSKGAELPDDIELRSASRSSLMQRGFRLPEVLGTDVGLHAGDAVHVGARP